MKLDPFPDPKTPSLIFFALINRVAEVQIDILRSVRLQDRENCCLHFPVVLVSPDIFMFSHRFDFRMFGLVAICVIAISSPLLAVPFLPPGHKPVPHGKHYLTGATIIPKPGVTNLNFVIIVNNGVIESIGPNIKPPADARIWDMTGTTLYPGFIDIYLTLSQSASPVVTTMTIPIQATSRVERGVRFFGVPGQETDSGIAGPSYENDRITPEKRASDGFATDPKSLESLRELGFTAANIIPTKGILRGSSAFILLNESNPNDSILRADVFQHFAFEPERGGDDSYPGSLMGVIAATRQALLDAQHHRDIAAHLKSKPQAGIRAPTNPALDSLQPLLAGNMTAVIEPGSALMVDRAWRLANEFNLKSIIVSSGQEWRRPELAAATKSPFIVPLNFSEPPKLPDADDWNQVTLDQLRAWDWAPENPALLRRQGLQIALTMHGLADRKQFHNKLLAAIGRGLNEKDALAALTTTPAELCGLGQMLGTIEKDKIANFTVVTGTNYFIPDAKIHSVWINGQSFANPPQKPAAKKPVDPPKATKVRAAKSPADFRGPIAASKSIVISNAFVWTSGPKGFLKNTDILIEGGKFKAIGKKLAAAVNHTKDTIIINGTGRHITPGLIDAHNHSMILGGVNESTLPSTAMVRISDVVNSESENIYLQLAGGLTMANLLHGSANPIGGQNAVIKLRHGDAPQDLIFKSAPLGIKFALGENVKQSNWGDKKTTRFPQSRMGVRTFINNRFLAAQDYQRRWLDFKNGKGTPPRRDLELEAIVEILEGHRKIHCHSYRQDEILVFLRLMEDFKVQVGTLQHVLEGYKIADEIARHGAGASCFSDWWAYKYEVIDAIPYAGALMHNRGATVSFNSDSSDLARRLNLEAAKAVKYGGLSEQDALGFVTINPARQLRIDQSVGSIEPGKDADFVIWSKSPLDSGTLCLETWIDGKKYFDRDLSKKRSTDLQSERDALLASAKMTADAGNGDFNAAVVAFFRHAIEHEQDQHGCFECGDERHKR